MEQLVVDDLLGPAGAPFEEADEAQRHDRHLVGKLTPRNEAIRPALSDKPTVADEGQR